jgi:hypothetical protein
MSSDSKSILALVTSFYTPALLRPFELAIAKYKLARSVVCIPYNQQNTFLLNPGAEIPDDVTANVLFLLRVEDFLRLELVTAKNGTVDPLALLTVLRQREAEFLDIISHMARLRLTVMICPSGKGAYVARVFGNAIHVTEHKIAAKFRRQQKHRVVNWSEFEQSAGAGNWFNPAGDRLGHVPFTPAGFDALADFFTEQLDRMPSVRMHADSAGADTSDFESFLAGLEVQIAISPLTSESEQTAIDLMRHTTHFITQPSGKWESGCLRSMAADSPSSEVYAVTVTDRFGRYGTSGAVVFVGDADNLTVRFLFLTCPVLGKQVEYGLLHWMAIFAEQRHAEFIAVPVVHGQDNLVLSRLLARVAGDCSASNGESRPPGTATDYLLRVAGLAERVMKAAPNPAALSTIVSRMAVNERVHV